MSEAITPPQPGSGQLLRFVLDRLAELSYVAEQTLPLNIKDGWRHFIAHPTAPRPPALGARLYRRMDAAARDRYDCQRVAWHEALPPIHHQQLADLVDRVALQVALNSRRRSGLRNGLAILGESGTGKTTALRTCGRRIEELARKAPNLRPKPYDDFVPVVYTNLPSPATPRAICAALVGFYDPVPRTATQAWLVERLRTVTYRCRTQVLLIDDLHFVRNGHRLQGQNSDLIKQLMNELPVTIIAAGVNSPQLSFLLEGLAAHDAAFAQTARRFGREDWLGFECRTKQQIKVWRTILASFEQQLVLHHARPGMLSGRLWRYLYQRSAGNMHSVAELISKAANWALLIGQEHIDEALCDEIPLDSSADAGRARRADTDGA